MNNSKLNWLRAGVLGANDGIVSVSVILVSVIGVLDFTKLVLVGISSILAGSLSMAVGEYISVSAQKDAEIAHHKTELTNPFHAAISSFSSFVIGALIPFIAGMIFASVPAIIIAVLIALAITAMVSAKVGNTPVKNPLIRNLVGGGLALGLGITLNILFDVLG
jgi:VIT1/CCC1 family predicted Fe2+/Mn2+ transporter